MKKISGFFLFFAMVAISSSAVLEQGFYELADSVLKGGNKYTIEEVQSISQLTDIPLHHRVIIEVSMLGSVEEESRYLAAIDKASDYIESGTVDWAKDYLRMQRGFAYGLLGDGEKGTKDLEAILNAGRLDSINSIDDPILDIMRKRTPDLALALDSTMRQIVGNYYMDFRKEGQLPTEAFRYFSSIRSEAFRDKCLLRLKARLGDDEYAKLANSFKTFDPSVHSDKNPVTRESTTENISGNKEDQKQQRQSVLLKEEKKSQLPATKKESINPFWYLGIGLILGFVLAFSLGRLRLLR